MSIKSLILNKKVVTWATSLLLLLIFSEKANAGLICGGEIYYQYKGSTNYRIYGVLYGSCTGTSIGSNEFGISDGNKTILYNVTKCCTSYYDEGISTSTCTRCPSNPTCSFPYGIQFVTFYADVDVSAFYGCKLTVFIQEPQMASNITTGGANSTLYISTTLNRCNGDHSSPQFQESPAMMMVNGSLVDLYQTVTPANKKDSIVYRFINPYSAAGSSIPYTSGYAYNHPLIYSGKFISDAKPEGFHYDPRTGEMYFTPQKEDITLIAIEADEYAKDKSGAWYLAGTTARTTATVCINSGNPKNSPQIATPAGIKNDTFYTCAGIPIYLQFKTLDLNNSNDTMTISNIVNETGGSFTYSNGTNPTASLNWTPDNNDVSSTPYKLVMMAADDGSPLYRFVQSSLYIYVIDSMPVDTITANTKGCGIYSFNVNSKRTAGQTYTWYVDGRPISYSDTASYTMPYNGKHFIDLQVVNALGCKWDYYDSVTVTILPDVKAAGGTKICQGSGTPLTAKGAVQYSWYPVAGLALDTGAIVNAYPDSTTWYFASGTDQNGCKAIDSVKVVVDAIPIPFHSDTTLCSGQIIDINGFSAGDVSYSWTNNAGNLISDSSGLYFKLVTDTQYIFKVSDNFGCTKTIKGNIKADHFVAGTSKNVSVCFGDSVQLNAYGGTSYSWVPALGLLHGSSIPNPFIMPSHNQYYLVAISDKYGCSFTDSVNVIVSNIRQLINQKFEICRGDSILLQASIGKNYSWLPQNNISNVQKRNIYVHPDSTTTYISSTCDTFCGCVVRDTFLVNVDPFVTASAGIDQHICEGHEATIGTKEIQGYGYVWKSLPAGYFSTQAQNIVKPLKSTTYLLNVENLSTGCSAHDTVKIIVNTFNTLFTGQTFVCLGDTDVYQVSTYNSSNIYSWKIKGGHTLFTGNKNAIVVWDTIGNNSVTLVEALPGGCKDSLSVNINSFSQPHSHISASSIICLGSAEVFIDSLSTPGITYLWNFGNGDTSHLKSPTYTYPSAGIYSISLVTSNSYCSSIDTTTVDVHNLPLRYPVVSHDGFRKYLLNNADSNGIIYTWYPGDGDSVNNSIVMHTYADTGLYHAVFKYGYPWGCSQTFDTAIHVTDTIISPPPDYQDTVYVVPNPFTDHINVDFSHHSQESVQIVVYDMLGQLISQKIINNQSPGAYAYTFQAWQVRSGIYLLKYQAGTFTKVFKIIKI